MDLTAIVYKICKLCDRLQHNRCIKGLYTDDNFICVRCEKNNEVTKQKKDDQQLRIKIVLPKSSSEGEVENRQDEEETHGDEMEIDEDAVENHEVAMETCEDEELETIEVTEETDDNFEENQLDLSDHNLRKGFKKKI